MSRFSLSAAVCLVALAAGTSAALAVDAVQLTAEFNGNQAGFKQKYIGRTLTVTGSIYATNLDWSRTGQRTSGPNFQLSGSFWRVVCYLNDADARRAMSLSPGQQATITGTLADAGQIGLDFAPCTFR